MDKLAAFIIKRPVKTLLVTLAVLIVVGIGATKIHLKTGNDTLISDKTDIYKDNEAYQQTFGKDPIIIIFDDEVQFSPETLALMYQMQTDVEDLDGVFSINSPVTIMNMITTKMYTETNLGLASMALNLEMVSNQLTQLGNQLASNESVDPNMISTVSDNLGNLIAAQDQLNLGLVSMFDTFSLMKLTSIGLKADIVELKGKIESDPLLVDELALIESIEADVVDLDAKLDVLISKEPLEDVPANTSQALGQIVTSLVTLSTTLTTQKDMMTTLSNALITMGTNLGQMATGIDNIQKNFNAFKPGFPTSPDTIDMMVRSGGVVKPQFNGFVIAEDKIRMVIVLNGDVTDVQIDAISETLFARVKAEDKENSVLISGKPILDRSIKSSMMSSMQSMMISAVLIMILILLLIYRIRMRFLPIVMILLAVVVTIGTMGFLSIGLTMVSMAVFPVLIGLGIDYFIQFQTRYEEERGK